MQYLMNMANKIHSNQISNNKWHIWYFEIKHSFKHSINFFFDLQFVLSLMHESNI